jgi:hypothetical protein
MLTTTSEMGIMPSTHFPEETMKTFCVNKRILHALCLLTLCGLPAREIHAASVIYHFDTYFGVSSVDPGSYGPWVTATFEDVTPGVVRLTMQNSSAMPTSQKVAEQSGGTGLQFESGPECEQSALQCLRFRRQLPNACDQPVN